MEAKFTENSQLKRPTRILMSSAPINRVKSSPSEKKQKNLQQQQKKPQQQQQQPQQQNDPQPQQPDLLLSLAADPSQADRLRSLLLQTPQSELQTSEPGTGHSPLIKAALYGNSAALRLLVSRGADVSAVGVGGNTALHLSAMRGDSDSVRCLLDAGAQSNAANSAGETPADLATNEEVCRLLAEYCRLMPRSGKYTDETKADAARITESSVSQLPSAAPGQALNVAPSVTHAPARLPGAISGPKKLNRSGGHNLGGTATLQQAAEKRAAVKDFLRRRSNGVVAKTPHQESPSEVHKVQVTLPKHPEQSESLMPKPDGDSLTNAAVRASSEVESFTMPNIESNKNKANASSPRKESGLLNGNLYDNAGNAHQNDCNTAASEPGNKAHMPECNLSNKDLMLPREPLLQWRQGPLLGRGSYGSVHQGLTDCGRIIAVKRVCVDCEAELRRIRREVEILSCLSHPNIVQLFGTRQSGGDFHIAMELVPGGSVRSLLDRFGALTERQCRGYLGQAVSGLAFLHDNGILHGDIKGHNIMVSDAGIVKLIDFGCSRRLHRQLGQEQPTMPSSMVGGSAASLDAASLNGTPYWMAPEVVLAFGCQPTSPDESGGGAGLQLKSDCWSVGCTLLEMATTLPPYADMSPFAAVFAIGRGTPEPPALPVGFSHRAVDFYAACLRREPKFRPSTQELLRHEFLLASP